MNLTIDQLRVTVAVARAASFSEAARELRLSQPAVTRTVRAVESVVGTELFSRTTRHVQATIEGEQFVRVAEEIVSGFDEGLNRFASYLRAESGILTVVALPSLATTTLPPIITRFCENRPDVKVNLVTARAVDALQLLRSGEVDIAITEHLANDDTVNSRPLGPDPMLAAVPAGHPLAHREEVTWAELAEAPFVGLTDSTSVRRLTDQGFAPLTPTAAITVDAIGAAAALVAQGFGVSAFPQSTLPLAVGYAIVYIPLISPVVTRRLAVMTARTPRPSTLAQVFTREVLEGHGL